MSNTTFTPANTDLEVVVTYDDGATEVYPVVGYTEYNDTIEPGVLAHYGRPERLQVLALSDFARSLRGSGLASINVRNADTLTVL